jgi:MYXO-CTERM domain-containing protein
MFSIHDWRKAAFAAAAATMVATVAGHASSDSPSDRQLDDAAMAAVPSVTTTDFCGEVPAGMRRCYAKRVNLPADRPVPLAPQGLGPSDFRSAYGLPTSGGGGRTVAIVDAYDAPTAESDLATYRSAFGLPPCTSANGCFKKVNQNGQTGSYPAADSGWAGEIALDLDMVSAVCPDCKILLVEATTADNANLGAAVNTAVQLGAVAISNSYGGPEDQNSSSDDAQYYTHPGVLITVSSGDSGFAAGASAPASGAHVLAVGGTSLSRSSSTRGWAEKAWRSGGSGCSAYTTKPSFQADPGCSKRMVADVSAVGDPATGVAVYSAGQWQVVGGTSASSPIIAGIFTLLNLQTTTNGFAYANRGSFFDVTSGTNGSCATSYFCTASAGYDGPTGIGTPNGALLAVPTQPDAGTPIDSGTPPVDSGTPPADAGSLPDASAHVDSGTPNPGARDASTGDTGAPNGDPPSPQPGVDGGTGDDAGSNSDSFLTPAAPPGCACSTPGTSSEAPGRTGLALFAVGALAIALRRRTHAAR